MFDDSSSALLEFPALPPEGQEGSELPVVTDCSCMVGDCMDLPWPRNAPAALFQGQARQSRENDTSRWHRMHRKSRESVTLDQLTCLAHLPWIGRLAPPPMSAMTTVLVVSRQKLL